MDERTVRTVERAASMLYDAWLLAMQLRESRAMWDRLAPALDGYDRTAVYLRMWYVDSLLAGCRRLLDLRRGQSSLDRALELLKGVVGGLDGATLAEAWRRVGHVPDDRDSLEDDAAGAIVAASDEPASGHLTRRMVERDRRRLRDDHERILELANIRVAHRPEDRADRPELIVEMAEIDAMLADILAVATRWTALSGGTHIVTDLPGGGEGEDMALALKLFDYGEYHDALWQAKRQLGPARPPEHYRRLEQSAKIIYDFPALDALL